MIPFGNETATLYARVEQRDERGRTHTTWRRALLTGCSWRRDAAWTRSGNELVRTQTVICRVPVGQAVPAPGDVLFLGVVEEPVDSATALERLMEAQRDAGAFRVGSVSDNARGGVPLPHYAARSE